MHTHTSSPQKFDTKINITKKVMHAEETRNGKRGKQNKNLFEA